MNKESSLLIKAEINKALDICKHSGLCDDAFVVSRFPYTYAYDYIRQKEVSMSRAEVAEMMEGLRIELGDEGFIQEVIFKALLFIMMTEPMSFTKALCYHEFSNYFLLVSNLCINRKS